MERINIGRKASLKKDARMVTDRTVCKKCGKQGSDECLTCPAKLIYDVNDDILRDTYYREYHQRLDDYIMHQ